jgi:hypothetical protein
MVDRENYISFDLDIDVNGGGRRRAGISSLAGDAVNNRRTDA